MIRTRFAPSPTGSLHIGNARIAVLNWLLARQDGGAFIVRIEDTDVDRNVTGAEEQILRDLQWLGLDWDEGPAFEGRPAAGPYGPYHQSQRGHLYAEAVATLTSENAVYECFCTDDDLAAVRERAIAKGEPVRYDRRCAGLTDAERARLRSRGRQPALRFRVADDAEITVGDAIRGEVRFALAEIGDFVIVRADGRPTYNFAVVVDDLAMAVTHVVRGAGHLSNTPRQILLFRALGSAPPVFAHVPTVLGQDRQKLSKRHGAAALEDYRREGYHPDALVNYLSLLSWSSPGGDEVLGRERLVREVSLDRIGVADVIYDPDKLRWLSAKHIERMPLEDLVEALRPHLGAWARRIPEERLPDAISAVRTHLSVFGEIDEHLAAFFPPAEGAQPDIEAVGTSGTAVVRAAIEILSAMESWDRPVIESAIRTIGQRTGTRGRDLYVPLRIVLTGREHGPPLWAVLAVQGRETTLRRLLGAAGTGSPTDNGEPSDAE